MSIPKKIDPCPIIEAVVEIRINTKIPGELMFGILYNKFQKDFPDVEKLPILQIPEQIRSIDPNLKYQPCYKLKSSKLSIQVGPKVISLANFEGYIGWQDFSEKIYNIFNIIFNSFKIDKIERAGVRYVNLFNNMNIFKTSNLHLSLSEKDISDEEINITANINSDPCKHRLIIVNKAEVVVAGSKHYKGSLIDIDTVLKELPDEFHKNADLFKEGIEKAHIEEKKLFFSLLNENFISTLNPEY